MSRARGRRRARGRGQRDLQQAPLTTPAFRAPSTPRSAEGGQAGNRESLINALVARML